MVDWSPAEAVVWIATRDKHRVLAAGKPLLAGGANDQSRGEALRIAALAALAGVEPSPSKAEALLDASLAIVHGGLRGGGWRVTGTTRRRPWETPAMQKRYPVRGAVWESCTPGADEAIGAAGTVEWCSVRIAAEDVMRDFPAGDAPEPTSRLEAPLPSPPLPRKRGPKPGTGGYAVSDAPLLDAMRVEVIGCVASGAPLSLHTIALSQVPRAVGDGQTQSKANRLVSGFRRRYPELAKTYENSRNLAERSTGDIDCPTLSTEHLSNGNGQHVPSRIRPHQSRL